MKKIIILKIIFICFSLNALAEVPNSMKKLEKKYSKNDEYLYSIGEGKNIDEAKMNAYINMADKYFYVGFKSDSIFLNQYKEKNINIAYMPLLEENPDLQEYAEIFNIEFIKEYNDKDENKYYIFSIANRSKLYYILKNKILKNESNIDVYSEHLMFEKDNINRFIYLEMIYILARKNYVYNKQIEAMNCECIELKYKYNDFLYKMEEEKNKLTFAISKNAGIGINKEISDLLYYNINKYGLNISSENNASYIFQINITLKTVEDRDTHRNSYESHFSFCILNNNNIIHTFKFQETLKGSLINNFNSAQNSVKHDVEKILREEFSIKLKEFFDNKIKNL